MIKKAVPPKQSFSIAITVELTLATVYFKVCISSI